MAKLLVSKQVEEVFWHRILAAHVIRAAIQDKDWNWFTSDPDDVIFWCDAAGLDPVQVYDRIRDVFEGYRLGTGTIDGILRGILRGDYTG